MICKPDEKVIEIKLDHPLNKSDVKIFLFAYSLINQILDVVGKVRSLIIALRKEDAEKEYVDRMIALAFESLAGFRRI